MRFDDQFTPEDYALIEQLQNDPRPQLKPEVFNTIQQRILAEMAAPSPQTPPRWSLPVPLWLVIAIVGIIVTIVVILLARSVSQPAPQRFTPTVPSAVITPNPTNAPTLSPTEPIPAPDTALPPTLAVTAEPATATLTPQSTATDTTLPPTGEATAEATAADEAGSDSPLLVIEGVVQKINGSVITLLDIDVQVEAGDPILLQLRVGDKVRVEGEAVQEGDAILIVAVKVTIINGIVIPPPVEGNPDLPPNCKISKSGKIKCSKKK